MTATPLGDNDKQDFDQAYETLVDSERYQSEFAEIEPTDFPEPSEPPQWLIDLLSFLGQTGSVWTGLFWIVAIMIGATLLFFIGRFLMRAYGDRVVSQSDDEEDIDWRPEEDVARSLLGEADALARDGRYAEAARLLLQRSVEDIERRLPNFMRPALTSRDISAAETMPAPARGAFGTIAQIVERGIFAAQPIDESGWSAARNAYEEFAFGESWR